MNPEAWLCGINGCPLKRDHAGPCAVDVTASRRRRAAAPVQPMLDELPASKLRPAPAAAPASGRGGRASAGGRGSGGRGRGSGSTEARSEELPELGAAWVKQVAADGSETFEGPRSHRYRTLKLARKAAAAYSEPTSLIGECVAVWWPHYKVWYEADVVDFDDMTAKHIMIYREDQMRLAERLLQDDPDGPKKDDPVVSWVVNGGIRGRPKKVEQHLHVVDGASPLPASAAKPKGTGSAAASAEARAALRRGRRRRRARRRRTAGFVVVVGRDAPVGQAGAGASAGRTRAGAGGGAEAASGGSLQRVRGLPDHRRLRAVRGLRSARREEGVRASLLRGGADEARGVPRAAEPSRGGSRRLHSGAAGGGSE